MALTSGAVPSDISDAKPDALVATGIPRGTRRSSLAKTLRFSSSRSGTASMANVAAAKSTSLDLHYWMESRYGTCTGTELRERRPDALHPLGCRAGWLDCRHAPAACEEDSRDIAAHQPETQHDSVRSPASARPPFSPTCIASTPMLRSWVTVAVRASLATGCGRLADKFRRSPQPPSASISKAFARPCRSFCGWLASE
jgi:hypothetical protein